MEMHEILRQYQALPSNVRAYTGDDARAKLAPIRDIDNAIAILMEG